MVRSASTTGITPQHRLRRRAICSLSGSARIVAAGRRLASARAGRPDAAATTIKAASSWRVIRHAASTAASVIASMSADNGAPRPAPGGPPISGTPRPPCRSPASSSTASTGYCPMALSPESITASVPSRTALNTSLASARVGRLELLHAVEHLRGRDHRPVRPVARRDDALLDRRHPLHVHLDAQVAARHHHRVGGGDDRLEVLHRLRLLDLDHDVRRCTPSPRARAAAAPRRPRCARTRAPRSRRRRRAARSSRGRAGPSRSASSTARSVPGRFRPCRDRSAPGQRHAQAGPAGRGVDHRHRDGAVGEQHRLAGLEVVRQLAIGAGQLALRWRGRRRRA